jgi:predicted negative regulator of RcsB-dependent stress response
VKISLKIIFIVSTLFSIYSKAEVQDNNRILEQAYEAVLDFRFEEAKVLIERIRSHDHVPYNAFHLENFIDFLKIFSSEDESLYDSLQFIRNERIRSIEDSYSDVPEYRFVLAEVKLHWAVLDFRFGHRIKSFREAIGAYQLLEENRKRYPEFILTKKSMAMFHALIGAIPERYRWGVKLISGMEGSIEQGLSEITEVMEWSKDRSPHFYKESLIAKAYILIHLANNPSGAQELLNSSPIKNDFSPLMCFVMANVALKNNQSRRALSYLNEKLEQSGAYPIAFLYFMRGLARLHMLDTNSKEDFQKFIQETKGESFIKESYQKIAWAEWIEGSETGYFQAMNKVLNVGNDEEGGDQHAEEEAKRALLPNVTLLKARLLYDGGQCADAEQLLSRYRLSNFNPYEQLEYTYRMARIAHCLGNQLEAVIYYHQVLASNQDYGSYYPCNAALQLGLIFESIKDKEEARKYYTQCLEISPDEYARYLHIQAKAGLKRIE